MVGTPVVQNGNATAATLTVNIAGSSTFAGVMADGPGGGALSLTKTGPGALTLGGNGTYTGGTTVLGGTLYTTASGTIGPGPLTINAANGAVSAVNLGNNQTVSSLSGTFTGTGVVSLTIGAGMTLTDSQSSANTAFQGVLINSGTFAKSGTSSLEINSAPTLNANSVLQVNGGKLQFNFVAGAATIGTGVTATVNNGATLELAGTVSALSTGASRVNVVNNSSAAAGVLISGTNQVVGAIDGTGTTQVNAGSDLTANHIIQGALMVGGSSGSPGLVTIDASDASGNPLYQSSGLALASSLTPSDPIGADGIDSANLSSGASTDLAALSTGKPAVGGNASSVPEPSTLVLLLVAVSLIVGCRNAG